jgi:carboxylesterase
MTTTPASDLVNPHLEGGPFLWKAGEVGLVLVHGFTATTAEVRPLARILHAQGYTVAGPLLPGHGTTPDEMNRCHRRDWEEAVQACFLDLVARCRVIFVGGESMGSLLTLQLAAAHPEIAGVLSYAPAIAFPSKLNSFIAPFLAPFIATWQKPVRSPTAASPIWQGYPVNPISAFVQMARLQKEVTRLLPKIHQPLLVVQGRLDQSISPSSAKIVYQGVGSQTKEIHWMDSSTHCVILDCEYERVAELTLAFLNRVSVQDR